MLATNNHREVAPTHFILFAAVIWPNIWLLSRIAVYAVVVSSGLSVALPRYSLPACLARACKPATLAVEPGRFASMVGLAGAAVTDMSHPRQAKKAVVFMSTVGVSCAGSDCDLL